MCAEHLPGPGTVPYISCKTHNGPGSIRVLVFADGETEAQRDRAKVPQLREAQGVRPSPLAVQAIFPGPALPKACAIEL